MRWRKRLSGIRSWFISFISDPASIRAESLFVITLELLLLALWLGWSATLLGVGLLSFVNVTVGVSTFALLEFGLWLQRRRRSN